ncbi:ABC transporter [Oleiharenicola lentus]|uniref:ABC transporter n=1 Tax=Oleiharenicola lentus TaxID=2508720 RepID=A0A4Q1C9R7_9BACT|nr:GldG family protein [Oleiharenicola lentus]RXK55773.1 ABC transporter [Oleiharenicola lentus]
MASYDSFRAARLIRFVNLILQAVLFLALFIGLNYIALNHTWRFDLSESRRYSLSAETRAYLANLERDVRIYVTIPADGADAELEQARRDIMALLREYTYHAGKVTQHRIDVRSLDIYQSRRDAEELGLDQPNQVVLVTDRHRHVLALGDFYTTRDLQIEGFHGEAALTAAILDVTKAEKQKIYFLTGHDEMRPDDVDRRRGLSGLREELRQRNYDVASLDLTLSRQIPEDAAMVVVASPQKPVRPFEEMLLRDYLTTRAGRLVLMIDPGVAHGLENLALDWGVRIYDNVIYDLDPRSLTETNDTRLWRFLPDPESGITDNFVNGSGLSLIVGPARVVSDDLARSVDEGLRVKKLIATSKEAWGESSYRLRNVLPSYTPEQDLKGELGVMVISERLKPANLPLSVRGGRLAVLGTADLVTNDRINTVGNLNLFLATVRWAIDQDNRLNIPVRPIERFQLALSADELMRLRVGLLLGVPGLVAAMGLFVYWTRRN